MTGDAQQRHRQLHRPCARCGDPWIAHEHYHGGTECIRCPCRAFRRWFPLARWRRGWLR